MGSAVQLAPAPARHAGGARHADGEPSLLRVVGASLARAALLLGLSLTLWAALPVVLGNTTTVVMSGSMAPAIMAGDAAVTRPVEPGALEVGQIVLVADPDHPDRLRLHRISALSGEHELVLRGDANVADDSSRVLRSDVVGVVMLRVPAVGLPAVLALTEQWWLLAALAVGVALLLKLATVDRRSDGADDDSRGLSPAWATAIGALAVVMFVVSAVAPRSDALFSVATANGPNSVATLPFYTCNAAILAAVPFVYFRLDDTSGNTALDSSGNGRNGQYQGSVSKSQPRACVRDTGTAVALNGTSGFVRTANTTLAAPASYTISVWFKTTSTTGGRLLGFGNQRTTRSTTFDRHVYLTAAGQLVFGAQPGLTTVSTSGVFNDGAWHHVAATQSATTMTLYVDGVVQGTAAHPTTQAYNGFWRVGWDNLQGWPGFATATNYYIAATLDNAVVYTSALSASQIQVQYAAGK